MASALFSVAGSQAQVAHAVALNTPIALAVVDGYGVQSVQWFVVGVSHETLATPEITKTGSLTATITLPTSAFDIAVLIECVVNNGRGPDGKPDSSLVCRRLVGSTATQSWVPFVAGETTERGPLAGWATLLNQLLSSVT